MSDGKEAVILRIYVGEAEEWQGKPLHSAIVEEARKRGLAGATVLRGIEGFGLRKDAAPASPLIIEIVEWEDAAQTFLEAIEEMVQEALVTAQKVHVVSYRSKMP